jgi:hypothetical protein
MLSPPQANVPQFHLIWKVELSVVALSNSIRALVLVSEVGMIIQRRRYDFEIWPNLVLVDVCAYVEPFLLTETEWTDIKDVSRIYQSPPE